MMLSSDSPFLPSGEPPLALTAPSPAGFHGPGYVPSPASRALGGATGTGGDARRLSSSTLAQRSGAPIRRRQRRRRSSFAFAPRFADPATLAELEAQARAPLDPSLSPLFAVDGASRLSVATSEEAEASASSAPSGSAADAPTTTSTRNDTLPLLPLAPHPAAEDAPPWLERLIWPQDNLWRRLAIQRSLMLPLLRLPSLVAGYQGDWLELDAAGAGAAWGAAPLEPCSNPKPVVAAILCPSADAPAASRFAFAEVASCYERSRLGSHARIRGLPAGGSGVFTFGDDGDDDDGDRGRQPPGAGASGGIAGAAARLRSALRLAAASPCWQGLGATRGAGGGCLDGGGGPEPHVVVYVVPPPPLASEGDEVGSPKTLRRSFADAPRSALASVLEASAALRGPATATAATLASTTTAQNGTNSNSRRQRPLRVTLQLVPRSALSSLSSSCSPSCPSLPLSEPAARAARAVAFAVFSKLPATAPASASPSVVAHEPLMFLAGDGDGGGRERGRCSSDGDADDADDADADDADADDVDADDVASAGRTLHCCYLPVVDSPPVDSARNDDDDAVALSGQHFNDEDSDGDDGRSSRSRQRQRRLVAVAWTDSRGKLLSARAIRVHASPASHSLPSSSPSEASFVSALVSAVLSETARFRARAVASAERANEAAAASAASFSSSSRRRGRRRSSSGDDASPPASVAPPPPPPRSPPPHPTSPPLPPLRRILVARLGSPHPDEAAAWRELLGYCRRGGEGGSGGATDGGGETVAAVALSFDPPFRLTRAADAPGFPFLAIESEGEEEGEEGGQGRRRRREGAGAVVVFPPLSAATSDGCRSLPSGPAASVEVDSARTLRLRLLGGASAAPAASTAASKEGASFSRRSSAPSTPSGFLRWAGGELAALSSLEAATEAASLSLPPGCSSSSSPAAAAAATAGGTVPAGLSPAAHLPVHAAAVLRLARLCEAARLR